MFHFNPKTPDLTTIKKKQAKLQISHS